MQVYHSFDVDDIVVQAVDDRVGKALKVELSIVTSDFTPALGFGHDTAQRVFEFINEVVA